MQNETAFHHFHVQHFCPAAMSLEQMGDRWSFLIVRSLLPGPQRFTDLQHYLAGITPKRLTVHLRALEAEGMITREREEGRREVWYRLTAKGQDFAPVIRALTLWGVKHAMRAPLPGEMVYPERMMGISGIYFSACGPRLAQPVRWTVRLSAKVVFTLTFDGEQWSVEPEDVPDADATIETSPETWATFLASPPDERRRLLETMHITGAPARVDELLAIDWGEP
jgi:DNA-binding HxlR family transcriptional regulator